ncbi:hypothetical protein MUK42_18806 [Musa troglodytarum]|uniref:Large ribosomal subunit protein bL20c n=1 Tax=Musa troglodytarum TaxID=320322 RepID=A0A9E7HLZ0_9LILI|nr:hypothetical protein MUK42_18806 [Musa troglodytarum]
MLLSGIPFFFLTLYAVANEPHGLVRPDVQVSPVGRLWGPAVGGLDQEGGWLLGAEAVPPRFLPRSRDLVIQVGSDGSHPPRIITGRGIYDISALCSENERSFVRQIKMLSFAYSGQQRYALLIRVMGFSFISRKSETETGNRVLYSYSSLLHDLYKKQLLLNRKIPAQIAILNKNCLYMISNKIIK